LLSRSLVLENTAWNQMAAICSQRGGEEDSSAIAERPRDAGVTSTRKIAKWNFEPPFWGLRGNVDASCVRRWKTRGRLPIGDD